MSLLLNLLDDLERDTRTPLFHINYPYHQHHIQVPARRQYEPFLALYQQLEPQRSSHQVAVPPIGKNGFQVSMNVANFKPNELNVKVVDNCIVIEATHEEREDEHGFITRHLKRRYVLPPGYDSEKVVSTLSSDGVLTVSIPKPLPIEDKSKERVVQIQQVGPAYLNVKANKKDEKDEQQNTEGKTAEGGDVSVAAKQ